MLLSTASKSTWQVYQAVAHRLHVPTGAGPITCHRSCCAVQRRAHSLGLLPRLLLLLALSPEGLVFLGVAFRLLLLVLVCCVDWREGKRAATALLPLAAAGLAARCAAAAAAARPQPREPEWTATPSCLQHQGRIRMRSGRSGGCGRGASEASGPMPPSSCSIHCWDCDCAVRHASLVPAGPTLRFLLGPCSSCSFRFRHQNQPATAAAVKSTTAVLACPDDRDVVTAAVLQRCGGLHSKQHTTARAGLGATLAATQAAASTSRQLTQTF